MRYSVENHRLRISVTATGAELCSLVNLDSGREYMWQADPAVWGSHAPVLFPNIGVVKDGQTMIDGQPYALPKHGIVRRNDRMELVEQAEDRITLRLCWSEETLRVYPYKFEFRITYRVRNEHVIVYHEITNPTNEPIYFCLGGHPAFNVPLYDHQRYDAHLLRFEHDEDAASHTVTPAGTLTRATRPVPWTDGNVLPLSHDLFTNDALVFRDLNSRSVTLESRITGPILKLDYAGWTHLGVWAKPEGDFVCIEPWMGLSDFEDADGRFKTKEGVIKLAGNTSYEMSYDIKVF